MQHSMTRKALLAGAAGLCAAMALTLSGCTKGKDDGVSGGSSMNPGSSNATHSTTKSHNTTGSNGNLPEDNASNGVISDGNESGGAIGDTMSTDAAGRSRAGDGLGTGRSDGMSDSGNLPGAGMR